MQSVYPVVNEVKAAASLKSSSGLSNNLRVVPVNGRRIDEATGKLGRERRFRVLPNFISMRDGTRSGKRDFVYPAGLDERPRFKIRFCHSNWLFRYTVPLFQSSRTSIRYSSAVSKAACVQIYSFYFEMRFSRFLHGNFNFCNGKWNNIEIKE